MRINEAYNVRMVDERTQLRNLMRNSNSNAQEPDLYDIESLPLDWWSKYNPDKHYK